MIIRFWNEHTVRSSYHSQIHYDAMSYSMIVLYGRDDEDVGVVYKNKSSQNHLYKPFTAT